jgi:Fe-Mn family superoxide dismutase
LFVLENSINMKRRDAIKTSLLGAGAAFTFPVWSNSIAKTLYVPQSVQLPELSYGYNALEPYIDAMTMEIHHSKHHAGYTKKFNNALHEKGITFKSLPELFASVSKHSNALINNGGGFYNHSLFWTCMTPGGKKLKEGKLKTAIIESFGSVEAFKNEFEKAGKTQFGSGWAWLIVNSDKKLQVSQTANQNNPLMDIEEVNGTPILGLDVWEHAYYLKYQNKRGDYISAFWNVVDWEEVEKNYKEAIL